MTVVPSRPASLPPGLTVFERGWLSSNNILIHPAAGEEGATLIDSSHANHAEQTVQLLQHALGGQPLARLFNTHLHSDHCGGNAALQQRFGVPVSVPAGSAAAATAWDPAQLSFQATGQICPRFSVQRSFAAGDVLAAGGRVWQVLAAPGHDPDSVMLFDPEDGVLVSADALWENGFGVVFPEVSGEPGFDDVGAVLEFIGALPVRWVIPGHGAPFSDVQGALARARSRLAAWKAAPARHARHALKVLTKYHLMEVRAQPLAELLQWAATTPLVGGVRELHPELFDAGWSERLVHELLAAGALALRDGTVHDV